MKRKDNDFMDYNRIERTPSKKISNYKFKKTGINHKCKIVNIVQVGVFLSRSLFEFQVLLSSFMKYYLDVSFVLRIA